MKTLSNIKPTPEQLPIISDNRLGAEVIRGAAGSGKTSTAILRLRSLAYMFEERRERGDEASPVRVLVLTFNRTLKGYIQSLVDAQLTSLENAEITIQTFSKWSMNHLGFPIVVKNGDRERKLRELSKGISGLTGDYVIREVDYLLGRFTRKDTNQYLTAERTGRGAKPRVDRPLRRQILEQVIGPYREWLHDKGLSDWNDVALLMGNLEYKLSYDIAIIDESQDFSANQLRAIMYNMAEDHAITFVIDTLQKIYARGFTWSEVGLSSRSTRYYSLQENHRNTAEIANFAAGILDNIEVEPDGAMPNLAAAKNKGSLPIVIKGLYSRQAAWALDFIERHVDLSKETVAFLKPEGRNFFNTIKSCLRVRGIAFVSITRAKDWPDGPENVALSTFHSAKGLEFDHVIILGLSTLNTPHGEEDADDQLVVLRRLFAVAIARARKNVIVGYKPGEESRLVQFLKPGTFQEIDL